MTKAQRWRWQEIFIAVLCITAIVVCLDVSGQVSELSQKAALREEPDRLVDQELPPYEIVLLLVKQGFEVSGKSDEIVGRRAIRGSWTTGLWRHSDLVIHVKIRFDRVEKYRIYTEYIEKEEKPD